MYCHFQTCHKMLANGEMHTSNAIYPECLNYIAHSEPVHRGSGPLQNDHRNLCADQTSHVIILTVFEQHI